MKKILFLAIFLALVVSFLPTSTDAGLVQCGLSQDDPNTKGIDDTQPCQLCDLFGVVNNIIVFLLFPSRALNNNVAVVPLVATLILLIGGVFLLVARDSPETLSKGKSILTATVIGLIIIYAAWVAVNTILTFLGVAEWTGLGSWWEIQCN